MSVDDAAQAERKVENKVQTARKNSTGLEGLAAVIHQFKQIGLKSHTCSLCTREMNEEEQVAFEEKCEEVAPKFDTQGVMVRPCGGGIHPEGGTLTLARRQGLDVRGASENAGA